MINTQFGPYSKSYKWIAMKFYGEVWVVKGTSDGGGDLDHHADCSIRNPTIRPTQEKVIHFQNSSETI